MEPVWYFISRAALTLIPLLLISFGAGLWLGWIKWHTWKREYHSVEQDYHKLHDIHDTARIVIPELEQHREVLSDEVQNLSGVLDEYKVANQKFEAESARLNEKMRVTKRNYEALEDIWRVKLATAEFRISELEAQLQNSVLALGTVSSPAAPAAVPIASLVPPPVEKPTHLIPFPTPTAESAPSPIASTPAPSAAPAKKPRKTKSRKAI